MVEPQVKRLTIHRSKFQSTDHWRGSGLLKEACYLPRQLWLNEVVRQRNRQILLSWSEQAHSSLAIDI